jgi:uncharacterized protein (DUF2062 family)
VLQLDDSAHAIALGSAIGLFVGLTPTVGAQMLIVLVLAAVCQRFLNFNKLAAVMAVYVTNPLTLVPIYYFEYWLGTQFVDGDVTRAQFTEILRYEGWDGWWLTVCSLFLEVGLPLLIGSLIVSIIGGLCAYPAMRLLVRWYRSPCQIMTRTCEPRTTDSDSHARGESSKDLRPVGKALQHSTTVR